MPIDTAPPVIEQSDFTAGLATVPDATGMPAGTLQDVLNLLPDEGGSGALVTRKGYSQLISSMAASHYVKHLRKFRGNGVSYLIAVLTDETSSADNVQVWAVNLDASTAARIDTAGVTWANSTKNHWGVSVNEVYYGGSPGNGVYSWDPAGPTWDADAVHGSYREVVDDIDAGVDTDDEYGRDFAFTGKEHVVYGSDVFVPREGIRFRKWTDEDHYDKGERVSHQGAFGQSGTPKYWKSFRCIQAHNPDAVAAEPGIGADWRDYWQKVKLGLPTDDDGETTNDWYLVSYPQGSSVGVWYADRLFIRADHVLGKDWLLFSAPLHPEKGSDIPDLVFNPKDWAPGNDLRGPGGGWIPFNDGRSGGDIEAAHPFNNGLVVFKRQAVWFLSGASEESFEPRKLSDHVGCVGNKAFTECNGLLYFLSDDGLYVTDGVTAEPVENGDYLFTAIESRIDSMVSDAHGLRPELWQWHDRVWISMPRTSSDVVTYVYDPRYKSWWKTDLPVATANVQRRDGVPKMYFSPPGTTSPVYTYTGDTDNGTAIAWNAKTAWWPFSSFRAQRRIRRVWALVKGTMTHTITAYKDWSSSAAKTTNRAVSGSDSTFIEGEWFADSHAVAFKVSGPSAPAALYAVAVQTEPRRARHHA